MGILPRKKNHYIAVSGVMGSGKTTVARLLANKFNFLLVEEPIKENAFLPLFYQNPRRWAFHTQLAYLKDKTANLARINEILNRSGIIHDSPIYQEHFTYAKTQKVLGNMSGDEYALYERYYAELCKNIPVPDLIVQLDASLPVLTSRIKRRARGYEKNVNPSYLKTLVRLQKKWINEHPGLNVLRVNTDHLDLAADENHRSELAEKVKNALLA